MVTQKAIALFQKYSEENIQFKDIDNKYSQYPLTHACILIENILFDDPPIDIVCSSDRYSIYFLGDHLDCFLEKVKEEDIKQLVACGVNFYQDSYTLSKFI